MTTPANPPSPAPTPAPAPAPAPAPTNIPAIIDNAEYIALQKRYEDLKSESANYKGGVEYKDKLSKFEIDFGNWLETEKKKSTPQTKGFWDEIADFSLFT